MSDGIAVRLGDIGQSRAAAVVRPVRSDGRGVTAAGRKLAVLAGPSLDQRLETLGELPVGGALVTPGGDLPAPLIIHAVVQSSDEPVSLHTVQRALVNTLRRARDLGLESLAIAPMGTGVGNLVAEDMVDLFVEVLRDHLREGAPPRFLEIIVEGAYEEEMFQRQVAIPEVSGGLP